MDPDAWHELVAAHVALQRQQEQMVALLRRALTLIDLAVEASPDLRDFGADLHTDAARLLADMDGELAHLEQAMEALAPDDAS